MYILKEQRYSKSETTIKLRKERPMRKKVYAAWILAIIMVMSVYGKGTWKQSKYDGGDHSDRSRKAV